MSSPAIDTKAAVAVEVAKSAAGLLSQEGKTVVLDHLVSDMTSEALKALSPEARKKLLQALTGTEAAPSATTSAAGGRIKTVDGHPAVVGKITVNSQQLDTLLSEGSFNKTRKDQERYARELGGDRPYRYRMATRAENRAYVEGLVAKEENNTINEAEKNVLKTYRERFVRDAQGGLSVVGRRVDADGHGWCARDRGLPYYGALFVRASRGKGVRTEIEGSSSGSEEHCQNLMNNYGAYGWGGRWR